MARLDKERELNHFEATTRENSGRIHVAVPLVFLLALTTCAIVSPVAANTGTAGSLGLPTKSGEVSRDIWYKTEGPVSGPLAPRLQDDEYPRLNLRPPFGESRLIIWILA